MRVLLVGYGTLLDRASLGGSIGRGEASTKDFLPITVHGYKRLFNLRPDHYDTSQVISARPIENAAANVEPSADAKFNGVAFSVDRDELDVLDERERYYDRRRVAIETFATGETIEEGYLYTAPADAPQIRKSLSELLPRWNDIDLARRGAYRISEAFGLFYDATTYLANGETLMVDYYREHLARDGSE